MDVYIYGVVNCIRTIQSNCGVELVNFPKDIKLNAGNYRDIIDESVSKHKKAVEATKNQAIIDEFNDLEISYHILVALTEKFPPEKKPTKQADKNKTTPKSDQQPNKKEEQPGKPAGKNQN